MNDYEELERLCSRLEELYDRREDEKLRRELDAAYLRYPDVPALRVWDAILARDAGDSAGALEILDRILAEDPDAVDARLERAGVLLDLGRFDAALEELRRLRLLPEEDLEPDELAWVEFATGQCLDRLGRTGEAEEAFSRAARLAPREYRHPPRLTREEFEKLVEEALDSIPESFDPYLRQVAVVVEDYPRAGDPDPFLLGLYEGVPRTERTHEFEDHLDRVFIFKRNLEIEFPRRKRLLEEIRKTVIHEIAHHFGLGEEDMGPYA